MLQILCLPFRQVELIGLEAACLVGHSGLMFHRTICIHGQVQLMTRLGLTGIIVSRSK